MPSKQHEAPADMEEHVGTEGASSRSLVLIAHDHGEGCDKVGSLEHGDFAQGVRGSSEAPQRREEASPQPYNAIIVALLTSIKNTMVNMVAMFMRRDASRTKRECDYYGRPSGYSGFVAKHEPLRWGQCVVGVIP